MAMRNHEGYHDPTAAKAIRRFRKRKGVVKRDALTYRLDEVAGFRRLQRDLADTGSILK